MSQTADQSLYEIILVVPPDFTAHGELKALAGDKARLEFTDFKHDIGLSAFGATKARGEYLFFTESHCWPEPDVIELCMRAIDAHPEWAGLSCRSVPVCHNRLSEAEAAMYQADIEFGMKQHPWRKVLDQCFVTRRDVYEECGGLREELGHFAEWVLAAAYHARGYAIGYLEEARFHHFYIGRIGELKAFTLDFVQGEIRYLGEACRDPGYELIETPIEWCSRGDFDVAFARSALGARIRSGYLVGELFRALWRWGAIALVGDRLARSAARLAAGHARCVLSILCIVGTREATARGIRRYIAALIYFQRLECIHGSREAVGWASSPVSDQVMAQAGFNAPEVWRRRNFRWSEPEAVLRIKAAPGRNIIRIASPQIREALDRIGVKFYLDGRRVADAAITIDADAFVLRIDLPPSGTAMLVWTCPRFVAANDPRRLGLPVAGIDVSAADGASFAPSPANVTSG
ncbi:glycosyltransferase family 2 protein [Bradyrhizobium commune]